MAQDNPYKHSSDITDKDIAVNVESGIAKVSDSSNVTFSGAEYTHTLGRVSIRMKPLMDRVNEGFTSRGNTYLSGVKSQVKYSVYENVIKEEITLKSPETVRYSYDLWLSDWTVKVPNTTEIQKKPGLNSTKNSSPLSEKDFTFYARDSTIEINPDSWGNLVIFVDGKDVVVMPKPFAVDATGKKFELNYNLDKRNKLITITGDLAGAQYPIVIDPTERITNGYFATGTLAGWTISSNCPSGQWYVMVRSIPEPPWQWSEAFAGPSVCTASMSQPVDFTNVNTLNITADFGAPHYYKVGGLVQIYIDSTLIFNASEDNEFIDRSFDVSSWTGTHDLKFMILGGYDLPYWRIISVSAIGSDQPNPPVTTFTGTPTSGASPLTVAFTDTSTNSPTSWAWTFGDSQTSTVQNPSHTYTAAGTYTVSLTATNAGGSNNTVKDGYVTVLDQGPVADFTASNISGDSPLLVRFTDNSTGSPTSWNWSFGDGEYSTEQDPLHTFIVAGTYNVSLTVGDENGNDTETKPDLISVICPYACDATLTNPPYIHFGIDNVTFPNDSGVWQQANCYDNALIRWARAGDSSSFYATLLPWMWKRNPCCSNPGYSYAVDTPANKPIYIAAVENPDADVVFHHHALDAELLTAENAWNSSWESWNFFNYHELNITRGWNQQIPNGTSSFWTEVGIEWINELPGEGQYRGDTQITFYIAPNSSDIYTRAIIIPRVIQKIR
jgi:PKD repeat protein